MTDLLNNRSQHNFGVLDKIVAAQHCPHFAYHVHFTKQNNAIIQLKQSIKTTLRWLEAQAERARCSQLSLASAALVTSHDSGTS